MNTADPPHPPSPPPSRLARRLAGRPPALANAIAASRVLFRLAHRMEARIDEVLAPLGIDMREYLALILIADHAIEPLRPSDLSVTLDATRTQITRLLDGLEEKGLAQRQPGRGDRRSLELVLTPAGRQLLRNASPQVHAAYAAIWEPLGAEGTQDTLARLEQTYAALRPKDAP